MQYLEEECLNVNNCIMNWYTGCCQHLFFKFFNEQLFFFSVGFFPPRFVNHTSVLPLLLLFTYIVSFSHGLAEKCDNMNIYLWHKIFSSVPALFTLLAVEVRTRYMLSKPSHFLKVTRKTCTI